jgi:hypothetical protein
MHACLPSPSQGDASLEALFYSTTHGSVPSDDERCYYLAVQNDGTTFDANSVTSLERICYLDPYKTPQSITGSSALSMANSDRTGPPTRLRDRCAGSTEPSIEQPCSTMPTIMRPEDLARTEP